MYTYMYIYIYIYLNTYIFIYIYINMYIHTCNRYTHTHILPGGHREYGHGGRIGCPVCMLVRMCVFMCVCVRARVRVCVIDSGVCAHV